eukprot:CAMPEP_0201570672 /NCGR_PEP_ID=MMETSP0190_2-20130828/13021_1 /ASSEMBLY_ACC=CAM_ASM_000263 /TAXON_ID=37353 /ORGANISM="Rosalina sp." /LENGTH=1058 /DNA_ID=CAMNT_0047994443 /DNA_START=26 /DNA_END=3202 /DNA_ORIENTATION=-
MVTKLAFAVLALLISHSIAQTLWVYDPTTWRATPNSRLNIGSYATLNSQTLQKCKEACLGDQDIIPANSPDTWLKCSSITWDGDVDDESDTGTCNLYVTKFGFPSNGFILENDVIGEGSRRARLEFKGSTTYFEKPMDINITALMAAYTDNGYIYTETLYHHLVANVLRLNRKGYNQYVNQNNDDPLDYDQFLLYYRDAQPGYVNNSDDQLNNKYSVIVEYDDVVDEEECAKYCTRNRGAIDAELGTRCVSFNYNTDGRCHLLSFAMDGVQYNIEEDLIPRDAPEDVRTGWFYYEGLVGAGCWVVHGQCRKWNDATYVNQQAADDVTVGVNIGVIRVDARDPDCETLYGNQCTNPTKQWEYICLKNALIYHEDICDNDADKGTVAYWAEDGAPAAEIWNSWDLTEGCVIDLSVNPFDSTVEYNCYNGTINPRFSGKKFRDSIGEEEFSAGIDKKRCWDRANKWHRYCNIAEYYDGDDGTTAYLNVSWPSDGSYYLAPAIPCECDEFGMKIESTFGMGREYCTRNAEQTFCYRESQEDYWEELDILCDDVTSGDCVSTELYPSSNQNTGCYLYYPESGSESKVSVSYTCRDGGKYKYDDDYWVEENSAKYRPIRCGDLPASQDPCLASNEISWDFDTCLAFAETIHNSCGNNLEDPDEQIIVWFRPTGEIGTFPQFAEPYETTVIRGVVTGAEYTEDPDKKIIDMVPIRNGRWQTFSPVETGNLRQLNVYYQNINAANLSLTIWYGSGITESIFLNQVSIWVEATINNTNPDDVLKPIYVKFPLDAITLTAGDTYTWQVTSIPDSSSNNQSFGDLGYVRGDGYQNGIGDLAWDYLFIAWIEGIDDETAAMVAISIPETLKRPWFEIWCVMIIILFLIFLVFLCLLHWKRRYDEEQERKEDKKFQAELRQRAMLQAEAERNAKNGIVEEDDDYDYDDDDYEEDRHGREEEEEYGDDEYFGDDQYVDDEYDDGGAAPSKTTKSSRKGSNHLSPGGGDTGSGKDYKRVKSASRNEMAGSSDDGGDGYQEPTKKKKKKKKKKPKKKHSFADEDDGDDYQEFAD